MISDNYVTLDGNDLYRFRKTIMRNLFCSCFEKQSPISFLRYLLVLLKVSIVSLKKSTVKQVASVLLHC